MNTIRQILLLKRNFVWTVGPDQTVFESLRLMADKKASDVYLSANAPALIKINGECEPINSQILQLVVDHLTDISAMEIAPSNLLYSIYQYAIGFEVHLYLQALDGTKGIAVAHLPFSILHGTAFALAFCVIRPCVLFCAFLFFTGINNFTFV